MIEKIIFIKLVINLIKNTLHLFFYPFKKKKKPLSHFFQTENFKLKYEDLLIN